MAAARGYAAGMTVANLAYTSDFGQRVAYAQLTHEANVPEELATQLTQRAVDALHELAADEGFVLGEVKVVRVLKAIEVGPDGVAVLVPTVAEHEPAAVVEVVASAPVL